MLKHHHSHKLFYLLSKIRNFCSEERDAKADQDEDQGGGFKPDGLGAAPGRDQVPLVEVVDDVDLPTHVRLTVTL
jgi:hypothetical protein